MTLNFKENSFPDVSPASIWEAHKCVLRGKLMAPAAHSKRKKQKIINDLLLEIQTLELSQKQSGAQAVLASLIAARRALLEELGRRYRQRVALTNN